MSAITSEFTEIWHYRHLLRMLVVRDLKARYKNSAFGVLWSFLQPLGMMVVLTFAFVIINKGPADKPNYNIYILSGYLAWTFFSSSVVGGTGSIVANGGLVKKVYFPRILLPVSVVMSAVANFIFALPMFILVCLVTGHPLHSTLLLIPVALLIQGTFSVGLAFIFSTVNVFYRDTQFILDLVMLAWFFLTPIFYDISQARPVMIGGQIVDLALWVRRLNPMASMVNIFQELMYYGRITALDFWLRTAATSVVILVAGYLVFRRYSPRFGEEL